MISVVIPTLNAADTIGKTFACLFGPALDGFVREVIVSDGGSTDQTGAIADAAGAQIITGQRGRGRQLRAGAAQAKSDWILFLHADTYLEPGWVQEIRVIVEPYGRGCAPRGFPSDKRFAAAFRFALSDPSFGARQLERIVALRCRALKLPYGDQGLLISRRFYQELGGMPDLDLMEDVAFIRKVGWRRTRLLRSVAVTNASKFQKAGYLQRPLRNFFVLMLYFLRVPPRILVRLYG